MRKLLALAAVAAGLAVGVPATSSAGGWVVVSLDSAPVLHRDEDSEVGFTVLRHGVTPESSDDLSVVLTGADGTTHRFPAVQQGAVGHHVATIRVPDDGAYRLAVTSASGFVSADLGTVEVTPQPGSPATWTWPAVQWGTAALALLMAVFVVADVARSHRHGNADPATA